LNLRSLGNNFASGKRNEFAMLLAWPLQTSWSLYTTLQVCAMKLIWILGQQRRAKEIRRNK